MAGVIGQYVRTFAEATHCVFNGHLDDRHFREIAFQRIADLQEMDYELVEAKPTEKTVDSANVRNRDNSLGVGGGITARLMRIPKEWWEENQEKTTIKRVKEHDAAMKASSKKEGQYGKIEFEEVKS